MVDARLSNRSPAGEVHLSDVEGEPVVSLIFEQIYAAGIAQLSYLIGDTASGTATVVDPRPDAAVYLTLARKHNLAITHIFETHIHADFMSGARELAARLDHPEICLSHEGGATYGFEHRPIGDGDRFEFGSLLMTARHTPGHTPEHLSFMLAEKQRADTPWGVLSGDSLFVDSAGRPDLLGEEATDRLAEQLLHTLRDIYLHMDDRVILYPCHGAGSACGANIGDRMSSTIGYERLHNPFLQYGSMNEFKQFVLDEAPPEPRHYKRLKKVNAAGPPVLGTGPLVPALPPAAFKEAIGHGGAILVDTRDMLAFGGGHIPGAINIGAEPMLSVWAGWMLDSAQPVLLVLDHDDDLERVVRLFVRTGHTRFAGYLAGGLSAWQNAGLELRTLRQMPVHELHEGGGEVQILDVRGPDEWSGGHIPGARHAFVPDVLERAGELRKERPVVTYCNSGYRASIAASLLQANGFLDVRNVPGSWQAWVKAGLPVENGPGGAATK